MMNKIFMVLFFLTITELLLACSHENPLGKNALSLSGKFLYQASRYAEAQLNDSSTRDGFDFGKCVEDQARISAEYCNALYEKMVQFAEIQGGVFSKITVNDLTDANVYYQVLGYYNNQVYIGEKRHDRERSPTLQFTKSSYLN